MTFESLEYDCVTSIFPGEWMPRIRIEYGAARQTLSRFIRGYAVGAELRDE